MFNVRRFYTPAGANPESPIQWILIASIICFVCQSILVEGFNQAWMLQSLVLSGPGIKSGYIWTILTYALFHGGILHLLLNLLGLYFVGKPLEIHLGPRKLLGVYLCSIFLGGLAWLSLHLSSTSTLVGASAGILGLLMYFCCLYPDQPITLLLFFILPIQLKPKWLIAGVLGLEGFGLLVNELGGDANVANSAHLGGLLAGFICFRIFEKGLSFGSTKAASFEKPKWLKMKKRFSPQAFTVNISEKELLRKEVDRILDKINQEGFGSLSPQEKQILDKAKEFLKK